MTKPDTGGRGEGRTLDARLPWIARSPSEKARARRLVSQGRVKIASRYHETYIGKRGLVNYEAWDIEPVAALQAQGDER